MGYINIVPNFKSDHAVRICGDFKITINPILERTEYSLPKIEHLKAKFYFQYLNP